MKKRSIVAGIAGLISFIVFLPALRNQFMYWDDKDYVYENPFIRSLDALFLKQAFLGFYASNWHPLTWISHALDYALWGLNPLGHHLTNLILHGVNTFIVALLVTKLGAIRRETDRSMPLIQERTILLAAGITALLFGIHPLHVESVAWVAERKDLLCALFFLLAMFYYLDYAEVAGQQPAGNRKKPYFLALAFFILALLSKPMAVSLPCVLLILDWALFGRIDSRKSLMKAISEKMPFFALAVASSIVTVAAQRGSLELTHRIPLDTRLLVAARSLMVYLGKMIVPVNLIPFYQYPETASPWTFEYLAPAVTVLAITAACVFYARRQKAWSAAWFYFVVTLGPVLGIVQVGMQSMADRYTYLPSLGPFLLIGFGAATVYDKAESHKPQRPFLKPLVLAVASGIFLVLAVVTEAQIMIWKDPVQFWQYVVAKDPSTYIARNNLGNVYLAQGLTDAAIEEYRAALSLNPAYPEAHYNLGSAYSGKGLIQPAVQEYRTAIELKPGLAEAHFNLGLIYMQNGQMDAARAEFEAGLATKPDDARAQEILSFIMKAQSGFH